MARFNLRVPDTLRDRLDAAARQTRKTKNRLAIMAIDYYLEEVEFWVEAKQRLNSDEETVEHAAVLKELGLNSTTT
jgi:predicted DNA-binding protein